MKIIKNIDHDLQMFRPKKQKYYNLQELHLQPNNKNQH